MIKLNLEIDDEVQTYNLPQCWDDITIKTYEDLAQLKGSDLSDFKVAIDILSAITGMSEDTVMMLPVDEMPKILDKLKFVNTEVEKKDVEFIEIEGEKYYLKKDNNKLNNGEVISLNILQEKYKDNVESGMSDMLCLFLRKKKENGKLEAFKNSFMDRAELFRNNVNIPDVYNLFLFFSSGEKG